jgi:hypothetical protein
MGERGGGLLVVTAVRILCTVLGVCLGVDELCHTRLNGLNRSVYGAWGLLLLYIGKILQLPLLFGSCYLDHTPAELKTAYV